MLRPSPRLALSVSRRSLCLKATDNREELHRQLPPVPARLTVLSRGGRSRVRQALVTPALRTHPFYIAPPSEYGALSALALFFILGSTVKYLHGEVFSAALLKGFSALFLWVQLRWSEDMRILGNSLGDYTRVVRSNLSLGVVLFIVSEIMIFFGVFWAYFHSSLNPSVELGAVWPPKNLLVLEWWKWPTLSTALLLFSGFSVNVFFYGLKSLRQRKQLLLGALDGGSDAKLLAERVFRGRSTQPRLHLQPYVGGEYTGGKLASALGFYGYQLQLLYGGLICTILFGCLFLLCQRHEYGHAAYDITDGVYGTVFYAITGLHGFHVLLGLLLLIYTLLRALRQDFQRSSPHVGVSATVWYWHFVDVVWLFVYVLVYYWGSRSALAA